MLRSPTNVKFIALAASGVAHAAAFAVVAGHGGAHGNGLVERAVDPPAELPIEPLSAEALSRPEPAQEVAASPQPQRHMHTHPYPVSAAPLAAPSLTVARPEPPARFTIVVGGSHAPGRVAAAGEPDVAQTGPAGDEPISADRATTPARLLSSSPPHYPPQARALGVEAKVLLEIVVDAAGRVADSRLVHAAGMGFDEAALSAVGQYRFAPATLDGRAVPVRMRWAVEFRFD